jgi:DNA polymerase-3 subunit epsilon
MHALLRWLSEPGVRLVELDGTWAFPAHGAQRLHEWLQPAYDSTAHPFEDRRGLRPQHQPARSPFAAAG